MRLPRFFLLIVFQKLFSITYNKNCNILSINNLRDDGLFGRQRCQNHRPGSPQRHLQRPEVLHRPTPVTTYCDGGLHRTPDRRPAAKIRIRNDPPQPPRKRSAQSGSGGEPNAAANLFQKSGVCGTDRPSEHPLSTPPEDSACGPDNPFGDSLPPPQKYRLRDKPAFRTSTANPSRRQRRRSRQALRTFPATPAKYRLRDKPAFRTSAVLGENSACRADRRPEHPPPRGRAAQRTVGRPPQLRLHDPENDEDPTRA